MMTKVNIDLAQKGYPSPSMPMKMEDKERYPCFYYEGDAPLNLPKSGTMTIQFREASRSESDGDSGEHYCCTIEVQKIVSVEGGEPASPTKKYDNASDALDALVKVMQEEEAGEEE